MILSSEALATAAVNETREYNQIMFAVKQLRSALDRTANRVAKENAEWHDDPDAEDHLTYHAPADEQFPREARDEAIRQLVAHYLAELAIQESK